LTNYPYEKMNTRMRFQIPRTLESDFDEFLKNDIPGAVSDMELLPDWYDQFEEGYKTNKIRIELYPDTAKSRYSNTDNNLNCRASVSSGIKKGDMLRDESGVIYLLDWEVAPQPNNRASRALRCNAVLSFTRHMAEETDDEGYLVTPEHDEVLVDSLPLNAYRFDGRPEYSVYSGTPGVSPAALTVLTVQYNDKTKLLRVDDEFIWGPDTYYIVDINYLGVNLLQGHGAMTVQAMKKSGGEV
jgi:hypothetical protein